MRNSATFSLSALVLLPSLSLAEPSSSMWKRRFSRRTTSPLPALLTMPSTSEPTQSGAKVTDLPSSFSSSGTTGFRLYLGLGLPLGRPKWDIRTTVLAPLSRACLMVGMAPAMRWLLVTFLSASRGTLKSTCPTSNCQIHVLALDTLENCPSSSSSPGRFRTHPDEDALALQVDIGDGELARQRHGVCWFEGAKKTRKVVAHRK